MLSFVFVKGKFCVLQMVMVMGWGSKAVPQDTVMGRNIVGRVLRYLCINTPQTRADIFKYNLDVVRYVVFCDFRLCLCICNGEYSLR